MENSYSLLRNLILGPALVLAQAAPITGGTQAQDRQPAHIPVVDLASQRMHALELVEGDWAAIVPLQLSTASELSSFIYKTTEELLPLAWKSQSRTVATTLIEEAQRHGLDPVFLLAVMKHESRFNPEALGLFGEIGLMQIKPSTALWVAGRARISNFDLLNPTDNIRVGTAMLALLREQFKSEAPLYIAAYNMGASNVRRLLSENRRPAIYAGKVMKEYRALYGRLNTHLLQAAHTDRLSFGWHLAGLQIRGN